MTAHLIKIDSISDGRLKQYAQEVDQELIGRDVEAGDDWISTRELQRVEVKIREYWKTNPPLLDKEEACIQEFA